MRRFSIGLAALLLAGGTAAAQQDSIAPKTSKGDFALLFDLGGLANLALRSFGAFADTTAAGAGFGARFFVADNLALRLGLTVSGSSIDIPQGPDSLGLSDKLEVLRLGIAPAVLVDIVTVGPVAGYVGGEVGYAILNNSRDAADTSEVDVDATSSVFSAAAILGAEWFPWRQISLSGEYQFGFSTASSSREETRAGRPAVRFENPSETTFGLQSRGTITLGVSF